MESIVVTWQAPDGYRVSLCKECAHALDRVGSWPRSPSGEECQHVHEGEHVGVCSLCDLPAIDISIIGELVREEDVGGAQ